MTPPATPAPPAEPSLPQVQRVQAICCGPYWLGFVYGWARAVVEHSPITAVPNAPDWLLGAANVAGHIVPVVDLACWAGATPHAVPHANATRLLLGGQGAEQLALCFSGLPQPLLWQAGTPPGEPASAQTPPDLPEALAALAVAHLPLNGEVCSVLNAQALLEALLASLMDGLNPAQI